MPVRILYWNIEKFAINKIANPTANRRQKGSSITPAQAASDRLDYITANIWAALPQIIVVVEVSTAYSGPGEIVSGAGATGSTRLLTEIRNITGNNAWMLVPPLQTGPREAVAVYYDSTSLVFSGPWAWPGGGWGSVTQNGGTSGNYATPFNNVITTNRNVPANALYNVGRAESQCAANVTYTYNNTVATFLQGQQVTMFTRAPYHVTFAEINTNGIVQRNISLFAVHSPANHVGATNALNELTELDEITSAPANTEVKVVVGDFNVNLMSTLYAQTAAYNGLVNAGYTLGLVPLNNVPNPLFGYPGYYATHVKRPNNAVYWSTQNTTTYYPGYGMIGADLVQNLYAIDNVYTWHGNGANPPNNNNLTILNGIVGSPYNLHNAPGGAPQGSVALAIAMANTAFANPPAQGPQFSTGRWSSFRGWDNYGCIRSTSDHLALSIDV